MTPAYKDTVTIRIRRGDREHLRHLQAVMAFKDERDTPIHELVHNAIMAHTVPHTEVVKGTIRAKAQYEGWDAPDFDKM